MLYDVTVLNEQVVWQTDLTTGSKRYAQERGKYLVPRVTAVEVRDQRGTKVWLDD